MTCNKKVKFEHLAVKAKELGCDLLATGHYARIRKHPTRGDYRLMRARGTAKDQSYVLYMLSQEQLAMTWFPLGELPDKTETRVWHARWVCRWRTSRTVRRSAL